MADKFYKKAIKVNKAEAYHRLGHLYLKNKKVGWRKYFEKAIQAGSSRAIECYSGLLLMNKDKLSAEKVLQDAWKNGSERSGFLLGTLYEDIDKDIDKARDHYLNLTEKSKSGYPYHRLAHLYADHYKDNNQAVDYFKSAIKYGEESCKKCLAWNYFKSRTNKAEALSLSSEAFEQKKSQRVSHIHACILLWNDRITDSLEIADNFMNDIDFTASHQSETFEYLMLLLKRGLYNIADDYFQDDTNNLKEQYKPLYFALMNFMQDKYPNEINRMGSEITDTVLDIINDIKNGI